MIEHADLSKRDLYAIPEARSAIRREAEKTLGRIRESRRMAGSQRDELVSKLTRALADGDTPEAAQLLNTLDTQARRILRHVD